MLRLNGFPGFAASRAYYAMFYAAQALLEGEGLSFSKASGHEQKGRRQVLIVSPESFNRVTKVPVVVPITSRGSFARTAGFAVPLAGAGTRTKGVVRCDQPRALDLGARGGRRLESAPDGITDEVLARLAPVLE